MDHDIAMKWADYLEKPGRKQAKGKLDRGGGARCCLGHLCAMLKVRRVKDTNGFYRYGNGEGDTSTEVLPPSVRDAAAMRTPNGQLFSEGEGGPCLAHLNDTGVSLKGIADIIRRRWMDL